MIAVDTSALFAIAASESERGAFLKPIKSSPRAVCSAVIYGETVMVLTGRARRDALADVDDLLRALSIDVVTVDREAAGQAIEAFRRYGKGHHPARLNLADCFSYGLAKSLDIPLLFKGDDFSRTDIVPAWRP